MELELELIRNRERKLTPWMLLELVEEAVEEFHSMVLDSLEPDCLGLDSLGCLELGSLELDSLELEYEAPEALEVLLLGSLDQLLSYCVRRL